MPQVLVVRAAEISPADSIENLQDKGLLKKCITTAETPTTLNGQKPLFTDTTGCSEAVTNEEWKLAFQSEHSFHNFCHNFPAINQDKSNLTFNWLDNATGLTAHLGQDYIGLPHPCGADVFNWYVLMKDFHPEKGIYPVPTELTSHHTLNYLITKTDGQSRVIVGLGGYKRSTLGAPGEPFTIEVGLYQDTDWGDHFPNDPVISSCSIAECGSEFVYIDGAQFGYHITPGQEKSIDIDWGKVFNYLVATKYLKAPVSYGNADLTALNIYLGDEVHNMSAAHAYRSDLYQRNFSIDTAKSKYSADFNGDGKINLLDYATLVGDLLKTGAGLKTDLNADGKVNLLDLSIFLSQLKLNPIRIRSAQ